MTQPFDRSAVCEAPGDPDETLGEFWEDDPWSIAFKHNLSAYERNRLYLNQDGTGFADVSYVSDTDVDGDSRSAVAIDFDNDGDQDIALRQVGGQPLILFRNDFADQNWLKVSLKGTAANRFGIGARVVATIGARDVVRELYPVNSFNSQTQSQLHFGLGETEKVDRLTILWPGGEQQTIAEISANQHVLITEGEDTIRTITVGEAGTLKR